MTIFYFTSTGNSLYVAKTIGGTLYSIPQLIQEERFDFSDDTIGFVFPIYGWGLPRMVNSFFERVKWKADYTFAIGTYGAMQGAAMRNLVRKVETFGKRIDYAAALLMVDNYLPGFEMGDQISKLPQKDVKQNLAQIVADISTRAKNTPTASLPERIATSLIQAGSSAFLSGTRAQKYRINDSCTKCGVCAKVCPTANIEVTDTVKFSDRCEYCLGCVHVCPQNAIHLKNEKSGARFRNENITVKELIEANCRVS